MSELEKSATSKGLRSAFSALMLLGYHTFVTQVFGMFLFIIKTTNNFFYSGNSDGDLEICHMLVERYLKLYPNVSITFNRCIILIRTLSYTIALLFKVKKISFVFVFYHLLSFDIVDH